MNISIKESGIMFVIDKEDLSEGLSIELSGSDGVKTLVFGLGISEESDQKAIEKYSRLTELSKENLNRVK